MDGSNNTRTILVVEDERPLAEAVRLRLEKDGYGVVVAKSVEQALGYMEDLPKVDVIWLDHYLTGKQNGFDFVAKVKTNEKWKAVPIFVVSNTGAPDKKATYMSFGVNKYYVKADYRLDTIITDIEEFLNKGE